MRTLKIVCSAALLALGLATAAHADEWNKLTYLTFSGPVAMPGIVLPAGTYRFELMDPDSSRRVIRVSEKDGSKQYGIFLSISDQKLEPSKDPVVMFRETPAGNPQAVQAWFYPGETYGYEFVYPHDQAMKIAKATHQPVLSMKESPASTTDDERVASMRGAEVGRIDENGRPVSADEQLKDSSAQRPAPTAGAASSTTASTTTSSGSSASTPASSTTAAGSATTTASNTAASRPGANTEAQSNTAAAKGTTASAQPTTAPKSNTAQSTTASTNADQSSAASARSNRTGKNARDAQPVGTSGRASARSLPRTASPMPLLTLLAFVSLGAAGCVRVVRKAMA